MLTTAGTVRSATRLKSGSVAAVADRPGCGDGEAAPVSPICAPASVASRILPATSRPAAKHANRIRTEVNRRDMMVLYAVMWMRRPPPSGAFGQVTVSTPSRRSAVMRSPSTGIGRWNVRLKVPWPRSTRWYCSSAGPFAAHAGEGQPAVVVHRDRELVALDARQLRHDRRRRPSVSCRSTGGVQPAGPGANRSRRCWMASRSRIGSQRANAMTRSYPRNQESGIGNQCGISLNPES